MQHQAESTAFSSSMISRYPVRPRGSKPLAGTQNRGLGGGSSSLLTPDINLLRSRGRSASTSGRLRVDRTRPSSACGSAAAGDIGRARSPLGTFETSASQGQTGIGHGGSIRRSPELSDDSLEEPISAGVCRQRTYSDAGLGDPTVLTPSRAKRLKTYAKKVAEENDVPERGLFDFIDVSRFA